ncbi:MAG: T9SS type A sorting domain-containing protein [Bacteroidetes bacterium]|nr:T9SS type A sorting domain-containing protein [Bacteroidota bacterium]
MKNKFTKAIMIILLAVFGFISIANAAPDTKGTDFWLMFNYNDLGGSQTLSIFITSDVNTSGTVDVPGIGFTSPFNVAANTVTTVVIPNSAVISSNDIVENKGIHVTALNEVTVYGLNRKQFTTDAFLGLPVDILGTDYIVMAWGNNNVVPGTLFGITATVNSTTVTITPSVTTGIRTAGVPYNVLLNQGETYQLVNGTSGFANDLTGTLITSNQPIAVFGGHRCANTPVVFVCCCDHIVEMLPPTTTWGKNFVTEPLATRLNGDSWRILASQNSTSVSINGGPATVINKGQFIDQIIAVRSIISSDKPVLVAQYSNSSDYDGVTSDPFMMLIPPYEQFLASYTITTPASGFTGNYLNVVAPNAIVGAILLDGLPIPAGSFNPIGASGFSGAEINVALGSHSLQATLPFGVFSYGFDSFDSYGYPGGLSLAPIATITNLDVTPEIATNIVGTQHCVDGLVTDQNNQPVVGIRVDYLISGANPGAGFAFTNASGIAQYCYTGNNAGYDTIIGSTGSLSDTVLKIWQSALPVELSSFTSAVDNRDVVLKWSTVMELNNSGFDIERTSDHNSWTRIGNVAGNGTTNELRNYEFRDRNLASGTYNYRLKQIDFNGNFEYFNLSNEVEIGIPDRFSLSQNYPNPFNPNTKIAFEIPKEGNVTLSVYDNGGKLVSTLVNGYKAAGYYTVDFSASNLSSGVYFYKIEYNGLSKVMKMTVIK